MGYTGAWQGHQGGHFESSTGIGAALMPRGGIFSGLAGDVQKATLKQARLKITARQAAAAKTAVITRVAALLGLSYAQMMKALSDPAVAAWFNSAVAAVNAGQNPSPPPAAVVEAAKAAAGAPSGSGPGGAGGLPLVAKVGLGAGAVVAAVTVAKALFGGGKKAAA